MPQFRLSIFAVLLAAFTFPVLAQISTPEPGPQPLPGAWLFSYFRQRYDSRVEIDAQGHPYNVPLADPMRAEQLHLALSTDGRHWNTLNGGRPVWDHRLRDPFFQRGSDGLWRLVATGRGSSRTNAAD